ncbi:hypothetical protein TNIN_357941 [Trichonephila inaurata madagascariensis]|uniref:Uncharacterized protein n=1 Tax=Trichonephila inaurata madagascariensis TaxID=2747483 RepID=A0A8X6IVX8_9ARAC|nr:hypothetical protein TNIN_357941 [Trichonephila inaurata madagascariensis]
MDGGQRWLTLSRRTARRRRLYRVIRFQRERERAKRKSETSREGFRIMLLGRHLPPLIGGHNHFSITLFCTCCCHASLPTEMSPACFLFGQISGNQRGCSSCAGIEHSRA